jgi:hypothetical protein
MEQTLGYIIFGTGWPVLIIGSMYWLGQPWLMGVLPAFIVFLVLFIATIRGVITWSKSA